jgi:ribosomal protein L4
MNTKLYDLKGNEVSDIELPPVFNFPYRPEVIQKVMSTWILIITKDKADILLQEKL